MKINTSKLREQELAELRKQEDEQRGEIWKLRLQLASGQLQDPQKVRRARRDLARVLTVIRERERSATKGGTR